MSASRWLSLHLLHPFVKDFISPLGEEGIRQYKYVSANASVYYKHVSGPFADYLVSKTPLWVSPNVLTLLGFLNVLVAYFLVWFYCPTFTERAPRWVWFVVSGLLFWYRTLDNMDGKQARKLGCGSALGLSLDHGCDAVSSVLIPAIGCAYFQLGQSISTVVLIVAPPIGAFFVTWEEFYTGTFSLGPINGVDEGGLLTDLTFLLGGLMGPENLEKSTSTIIYGSWQVKHIWVLLVVLVVLGMTIPAIFKVVNTEKWKKAMFREFEAVKQSPTNAQTRGSIVQPGDESSDTGLPSAGPWHARHYKGKRPRVRDAFHATVPVILGSGLWICSVYFPFRQSGIFLEHTRAIIWLGVMLFSKLITHLHVAHVCGDPYYQWRRTYLIPLILLTANALYADTFSRTGEPLVDGFSMIIFCALMATLSWAHMCYSVITGMCRVLGIPFLTVPPRFLEAATAASRKKPTKSTSSKKSL